VAMMAQNMDLANAAVITAVMNQDGEGMDDLQRYARKQGVQMGLVEPNDEEKAEMEAAAQNQQPDPMIAVAGAQATALGAAAQKDVASAGKIRADTALSAAKATQVLADAQKKKAEAAEIKSRPPEPPKAPAAPQPMRIRRGYELEGARP